MVVVLVNHGNSYRVFYGGGWINGFPKDIKGTYQNARNYAKNLADKKDCPLWDETRQAKESELAKK